MFIELWQGLRDLAHENNDSTSVANMKRFINWTLKDLANEYDWEFLRGEINLTATGGSGVYSIDPILQLSATAEAIYGQSDATADGGDIIEVFGKSIPGSDADLIYQRDLITLVATATASGGVTFSHIDSIRRVAGDGTILVTNSSGVVLATLANTDIYVSNDINKVNKLISNTNDKQVKLYDYSTYQKGNPDNSNLGDDSAYDIDHMGQLRLMNVTVNDIFRIIYQREPRYLFNDQDRTEFKTALYPQIIDACYFGYVARYEDEADGTTLKAAYKAKMGQIIDAWLKGKDQRTSRVMPSWQKRRL